MITGWSHRESIHRYTHLSGCNRFQWDFDSVHWGYQICESESNLLADTREDGVDESRGIARRLQSEFPGGRSVSGSGPGVLVADDNEVIADTYAQFLADDYDVTAVYSGERALELLGHSVEVVLLDVGCRTARGTKCWSACRTVHSTVAS